jgi:outer membrane receptor protein involved in Fe transport
MNRFLLVLVALVAIPIAAETITGSVRDDTGAVIPGVTVTAGGSVTVTGTDGTFRITDLKPGTHTIEAALDGFQSVSKQIKLGTGQSIEVAFKLVPAFGETVEVTADAVQTGEVAILETRRQAAVVSDSISSEEIRKTPDSTAAGVVERLTGVTLVGDKYVFVRGLGERYSGTTINGSTLPTTETDKRVVPLDLFPARLLETVNVVKTYTPDKAGDFGSGLVEMTTTEFPGAAALKVTLGSAYTSGATGSRFRTYAGGLSRFGGGGQELPSMIPSDVLRGRTILDPSGFTAEELQTFGRALLGDWNGGDLDRAAPNSDLALTYGNTFGRLGIVFSATSSHGYDSIEEHQSFFGVSSGELVPYNEYDLATDRETATTGIVGNISYRLTDSNRIFLNSVLTRDASAESRFQEGLQSGTGGNIRDYRVRYQREEVSSSRLRGEHNLGGLGIGSLVEWNLAHSTATNDSDLRENVYRETDPGIFALETGYADSGKIEVHALEDQVQQGGIAYSVFFAPPSGAWSGMVKGGIDHLERTRDFGARRLRFVAGGNLDVDLTALPGEIYVEDNIGPGLFEIREFTGINDAYDAEHTIDAAFLMSDTTFGKWRLIGGARYEASEQRVTTFNPFAVENAVASINESSDVLPSLNVVYQLASKTNLRLGYGRSVNRPEFRELSPFTFTEVAGGRSVSGNPDLEQATLDAYDVRWETFPRSGEVIAVSAFFKNIDQPIERIIQPTTDLRQSFVNADSATLWGLELELRRELMRYWSVNFNYAWIQSDVTVGEQQFSVVTSRKRSLEGQSDQVVNLALQYFQPEWGTMLRILGGYSGPRLTEVGAFGLPDIYEDSYLSVDAVLSQSLPFAKGVDLKLAASNLLGERRQFMQGGQIHRSFDPGRKLSLSLSYSPF